MTETYTYDQRDRLTEIFADGEVSKLASREVKERYYAALARQPSRYAPWVMLTFAGLLLSATLAPLSWIGLSDRRRRRQVRHTSVALLLCVCMSVDPERVYAMNDEAIRAHAMMVAGIGTLGETTTTFAYDDNGNQIEKAVDSATTVYVFDAENRLVEFGPESYGTPTAAYTYDADGVRNSKTVGGTTTNFLTDKNRPYAQVIEEIDTTPPTPTVLMHYVYGDDLIAQTSDPTGTPTTSYFHYDGQMSTRQLTDENATPSASAVTDHYKYDAFGQQLIASPGLTANKYLYTGEQYDGDLGQYYLRARYYDHSLGRFISNDPIGGFRSDPHSLHKYLYANADPVDYRDPSGRFTVAEVNTSLGSVLQLANIGFKIIRGVQKAINTGTTLIELFNFLGGGGINRVKAQLESILLQWGTIQPRFKTARLLNQQFWSDAIAVLSRNAGRLVARTSAHHARGIINAFAELKGPKKKKFNWIIYMPTPHEDDPLFSPRVTLPLAGIKIGGVGFLLRFGGGTKDRPHRGRLFGFGIKPSDGQLNSQNDVQFFRMDYGDFHHGRGTKGKRDAISPWSDMGSQYEFHFHVPIN